MNKFIACAILALGVALPRRGQAQYVQSDPFLFQALNQNMWGGSSPGSTDYSTFAGLSWNVSHTFGSIAGSENTTIIPGGCLPWPADDVCWDPVTADTRTGLAITPETHGSIGVNVGATVNAGSVDVTMPGQATLSTGQLENITPGSTVTIQTGYAIDPSATLHTQGPSLEAYADFVFDVEASAGIEACLVGACTTTGGQIFDTGVLTKELAALNRNGDGQIRVFGEDVTSSVLSGAIGPVTYDISLPDLQTDAAAAATTLQSSGQDYFLGLAVNAPALIADIWGAGAAFEGDFYGMHYTTLGIDVGPQFGLGQTFTFESAPWTTLTFSTPVSRVVDQEFCVFGVCTTIPGVVLPPQLSWSAPLGTAFDFVFPDAMTIDVTPTYWLKNALDVNTDLLVRLGLDLTVLELDTPLGTIGPVYSDSYATDPVSFGLDDRRISLAFDTYQGSTFEMTATPEPSTWVLLATGLLVVGVIGWRRRAGV